MGRQGSSSDNEYDHLDIIKSESQMRRYFSKVAQCQEDNNPNIYCEQYLREKVSKFQGILAAMKERKSYVRQYVTRCEVRDTKHQKAQRMDLHSRFELESELESLRKEISDLKTSITKNLNENLMKELALLEAARIQQLKKLIYAYSKGAHLGLLRVEES